VAQSFVLGFDRCFDATSGKLKHFGEFCIAEGRFLAGALDFNELLRPGHHHVHIDRRCEIFSIVEVKQWLPVCNSHAHGRNALPQAEAGVGIAGGINGSKSIDQRNYPPVILSVRVPPVERIILFCHVGWYRDV